MIPYGPNYIKTRNRKLVFDLFMEEEELSRAEITRKTSMSFPTVLKVVNFLISKNIIFETGGTRSNNGGIGRKGRLLRFNPNAYSAVGVVLEGQFANIGLVNLKGEMLESEFINLKEQKEELRFCMLLDKIKEILNRNESTPVLGIGVGLPKKVNPERKVVIEYSDSTIENIKVQDDIEALSETLGLPVFIENDVKTISIGETFLRKNSDLKDLVYISLGSGLGSAIILDGRLRRGVNFIAGEIGALIFDKPENIDFKNLSMESVEKKINLKAIKDKFGVNIGMDIKVTESLKQEITEYICRYLALIIYHFVHILDINEFVISGIIPEFLGDDFYLYLKFFVRRLLKTSIKITPGISHHGGIVGGGVMVFNNMLEDSILSQE